jgi:hypothetical protein
MALLFLENYRFQVSVADLPAKHTLYSDVTLTVSPTTLTSPSSPTKQHTFYTIQISNAYFGTWQLRPLRYNDLLQFKQEIDHIAGVRRVLLPPFPAKAVMPLRSSVVQTRVRLLTNWLQALLDSELVSNEAVVLFLLLPRTKAPPLEAYLDDHLLVHMLRFFTPRQLCTVALLNTHLHRVSMDDRIWKPLVLRLNDSARLTPHLRSWRALYKHLTHVRWRSDESLLTPIASVTMSTATTKLEESLEVVLKTIASPIRSSPPPASPRDAVANGPTTFHKSIGVVSPTGNVYTLTESRSLLIHATEPLSSRQFSRWTFTFQWSSSSSSSVGHGDDGVQDCNDVVRQAGIVFGPLEELNRFEPIGTDQKGFGVFTTARDDGTYMLSGGVGMNELLEIDGRRKSPQQFGVKWKVR